MRMRTSLGFALKGIFSFQSMEIKTQKKCFWLKRALHFSSLPEHSTASKISGKKQQRRFSNFPMTNQKTFRLFSAIGMFSNAVLGNTWDVPAGHFKNMKRLSKESLIAKLDKTTAISKDTHYVSPYQFSLEESSPLISNGGGTAKVARSNVWPVLQQQALYSVLLTGKGMREPHWHPETAEMGYVAKGRGRSRSCLLQEKSILTSWKQEIFTLFPRPIHIILKTCDLQIFTFSFFLINRCRRTLDSRGV